MNDKYTVILRRWSEDSESDKYYPIATSDSVKSANYLAEQRIGEPGDIIIVCDTAGVSDLARYARDMYVCDEKGRARKPLNPRKELTNDHDSVNWIYAWEGVEARADYMVSMCDYFGVSKLIVSKIVIDCAKAALANDKSASKSDRKAIEVCDKFIDGKASAAEVQDAFHHTRHNMDLYFPNASSVSYNALMYVTQSQSESALHAIKIAAVVASNDSDESIRNFSVIVRAHVPMSAIMLAAYKRRKSVRNANV